MKFTIYGRLEGLNKVINANRRNKYEGNLLKKTEQKKVEESIPESICNKELKYPVKVSIIFYEPNNRRDVDNVISSQKFIFDAMTKKGVLKDDSRKYVSQVYDLVFTDKGNPRIEVEIHE